MIGELAWRDSVYGDSSPTCFDWKLSLGVLGNARVMQYLGGKHTQPDCRTACAVIRDEFEGCDLRNDTFSLLETSSININNFYFADVVMIIAFQARLDAFLRNS